MEPDDHVIYYNIGHSYKELEQYEKALKYFSKALEIEPDYTSAMDSYEEVRQILDSSTKDT